jgi:hypothetical protein
VKTQALLSFAFFCFAFKHNKKRKTQNCKTAKRLVTVQGKSWRQWPGWWAGADSVIKQIFTDIKVGNVVSSHLYLKNGSFCQDRLGTNIGKAQSEKRFYI